MIEINKIRNFCIIAHIDHGKSTLADCLLEHVGLLTAREYRPQVLDSMELERERGITIKAKNVRMEYVYNNETYILNLIDTPGHVDFYYEVERSLRACEGCLLVVDASQGVEAQTLANTQLAQFHDLVIIPVINKIDLPQARVDDTKEQIQEILGSEITPILVSAKNRTGTKEIFHSLISLIPPPQGTVNNPLTSIIFDSYYDAFRGVILYVRILDGILKPGMKIQLVSSGDVYDVSEVGYLQLKMAKSGQLSAGEVGYCIAGIKDIHQVRVGDTIIEKDKPSLRKLEKQPEIKPVVFCGLYPVNQSDFPNLHSALEKLHLTDASFYFHPDNSVSLGTGFRCGFLGLLHMDIVKERLEREFNLDLFVTMPNVTYQVRTRDGKVKEIDNPSHMPDQADITEICEPYVRITIIVSAEFLGAVMDLVKDQRGKFLSMKYVTPKRVVLNYELPLAEMVVDFYDRLKSVSRGYASFDYEHSSFRPGDLVKMQILVNYEPVDGLTFILHRTRAYERGKKLAEKLKSIIPRQLFEVPVQAQVDNRIVSRETIPALRKDVISKCYGGDITRKRKLLQKQKEGKRKLRRFGKVEIPAEAFLAALRLEE